MPSYDYCYDCGDYVRVGCYYCDDCFCRHGQNRWQRSHLLQLRVVAHLREPGHLLSQGWI